ncbi:hypothetical protein HSE3_gp012 [Bacillus phage vB_BceM-HSE3]|nr:hypothetical protein HSE3_gp012 [Bacillus phage vB_BceM-HSE3]
MHLQLWDIMRIHAEGNYVIGDQFISTDENIIEINEDNKLVDYRGSELTRVDKLSQQKWMLWCERLEYIPTDEIQSRLEIGYKVFREFLNKDEVVRVKVFSGNKFNTQDLAVSKFISQEVRQEDIESAITQSMEPFQGEE